MKMNLEIDFLHGHFCKLGKDNNSRKQILDGFISIPCNDPRVSTDLCLGWNFFNSIFSNGIPSKLQNIGFTGLIP